MIPRLKLVHLPTPVEFLPRLSARLGGPQILVKRDDLTGLAFGGNKTRKLEFLLADAQAKESRTILTSGAVQSNHCRQTAAASARFGFDCLLVLAGDPPEHPSANLLLDNLLGAEIVWTTPSERDAALQEAFEKASAEGRKPYLIPYGGSNPLGALAYAYAMEELLRQDTQADWIVFATSSGGTHAGLALGARAFGYQGRLLGISVDEPWAVLQERTARLASETSLLLERKSDFKPGEILVNADYCSAGYGVMTAAEVEAIRLFAHHEGLLLDPVYTGRAAAGMIDLIRRGSFKKGERVLFWHTGGQPALFSEKYQAMLSATS